MKDGKALPANRRRRFFVRFHQRGEAPSSPLFYPSPNGGLKAAQTVVQYILAVHLTSNIMNDIDKEHHRHYTELEEVKTLKFYGYERVSTETQAEKGYGLDAQDKEIRKYAEAQGIQLEKIFTDAGISGNMKDTDDDEAIGKREALMELLSCLGEGDSVIVLNTSRLWRSDMTKAIIRRELMKRGAKIISIEQPKYDLYTKDPNDYLINAIMEALDVYERMSISLKLARGRTMKAKGGDKPAGVCPFGYRYTADKKHVEVDPAEAAIVRSIFTEGQKGQSLQQIADGLNRKGVNTRRGKSWSSGSVQAILRNRFYVGDLLHQEKYIKGNHEPIISKVQFGKCQSQLDQRRRG